MVSETTKQFVFHWGGRVLRSTALSWMVQVFFRHRANIIFYHAVWPKNDRRMALFGNGIDLDRFVADMKALSCRFKFVSLEALLQDGGKDHSGRPRLVVTFDDGFDLNVGSTTDVMDEFGIHATAFVNTASVNYQQLMWQHRFVTIRQLRGDEIFIKQFNRLQEQFGETGRLSSQADEQIYLTQNWPMDKKDEYVDELWRACDMPPMDELLNEHRPYFDWDGLRTWIERGHAVGFHAHTHPFCSRIDRDLIERELIEPVTEFKDRLGLTTIPFAYPFGERLPPEHEQELVKRGLFTCLLGTSDTFSMSDTDPKALVRVEAETGIDKEVFGRAVIRAIKRKFI
ncbi:MAG: hypothetical protein DRR19_00445 [Candidatus Parabeggiatoa sp. nov. 1]|nr:MAG: hypothetical protein DRR19_00445 [Gammaproteobacteria bacterium]